MKKFLLFVLATACFSATHFVRVADGVKPEKYEAILFETDTIASSSPLNVRKFSTISLFASGLDSAYVLVAMKLGGAVPYASLSDTGSAYTVIDTIKANGYKSITTIGSFMKLTTTKVDAGVVVRGILSTY